MRLLQIILKHLKTNFVQKQQKSNKGGGTILKEGQGSKIGGGSRKKEGAPPSFPFLAKSLCLM